MHVDLYLCKEKLETLVVNVSLSPYSSSLSILVLPACTLIEVKPGFVVYIHTAPYPLPKLKLRN